MVVRIRLARWGASHNPFYGIVVANHRAPRDGKHLERVGTYNVIPDERGIKRIELNVERIKYWLGVGAQPTERVAWLLSKIDLMPPTPQQLQNQGFLSLNDSKTWDVEIRDAEGKTLSRLSPEEARNALANSPLAERLPQDTSSEPPEKSRVIYENIKLDGRPPKAPLTAEERLKVLQEVTGII
ncbi:hypothetical protein SpCBS45565_g06241 [Spizellomyces sp. 'palustris']|nr:hypothetical protein SpCBS45565_g06241 [Spizellomyces sp. 'palustris']